MLKGCDKMNTKIGLIIRLKLRLAPILPRPPLFNLMEGYANLYKSLYRNSTQARACRGRLLPSSEGSINYAYGLAQLGLGLGKTPLTAGYW